MEKRPSLWVSFIPIVALVAILTVAIKLFGSDALSGATQVALFAGTAICSAIALLAYRIPWKTLEDSICNNIRHVGSGIVILLLIGAIAGTWMVSGIVPTFIYYGLQILSPTFFLLTTCIICAVVSVMTGSSWTTIATVGVAFIGIGNALGFSPGWTAGAIISGAYFGDKISPLSDTTVLASTICNVPLFNHIRYMMITTVPSFVISLIIFLVAGFVLPHAGETSVMEVADAIKETFNLNPLMLIVPVLTALLIARRTPPMITLFCAALMAAMALLIFQPQLLSQIGGEGGARPIVAARAFFISIYGSTAIATGNPDLDVLVSTSGMAGMMDTIWLIICAVCFGGVMTGSGMLQRIISSFARRLNRTTSLVASTTGAGLLFNMCTADQYLSIILTGNLFKDVYKQTGHEERLLSRTTEDAVTVTSVLFPWSSCGMTQATVLGVATLTYLPYCFFNIISPIMTITVAALGIKIFRNKPETEAEEPANVE